MNCLGKLIVAFVIISVAIGFLIVFPMLLLLYAAIALMLII